MNERDCRSFVTLGALLLLPLCFLLAAYLIGNPQLTAVLT